MQCLAKAEVVDPDFLPGYTLMIAVEDAPDWHRGDYGLVQMNDPTFVFPPIPDPESDNFYALLAQLSEKFYFYPDIGHMLVCAAMSVGFDRMNDGWLLGWLMERIYTRTARNKQI